MQKIACIFSFKMSSWVSCQKIVFNLHKAYQLNKDLELMNFNYSVDQTATEILHLAKAIVAAAPDIIVILDHKPHPLAILQLVLPQLEKKKPRIIFHVFGDFSLYYSYWEKLEKTLAGHQVDFLVASERQKHLLDKFLSDNIHAQVCPFPVDKHDFSYNPTLRKLQRKEWGLKESDMAFVFTGRLSRQKRTHTLLRSFSEFLERTKADNAHLFLYGNTDYVGDQFLGKWEIEGEYFRKINRLYRSLSPEVQSRIHFMGSVPNVELKGVYQGADMLVNLSVHNDEDYGMSVAEAQCSGLPTILTDWGGLASFHHHELPDATVFIPVKIGKRSKLIHYESIVKAFEDTLRKGPFENRELISKKALERFEIEASHKIVQKIIQSHPATFTKFSPLLDKILRAFLYSNLPYITEMKTISKLYREIYSSYVRNH
jgi:glycosyltransferase involved in cell wall biosynthesis